ncbi:hypothetical protein PHMEG_0005084 [Phytophthora megakarya]|uniref:Uncharacterized protein n=1 Tax=Phytophthora megakarya TaxID=4795 RepID=A0A225WTS1_9STRA|nr:hypothetical protein PHMEG_0005084 [Phytophthora megakarya]
MNVWALNDEPVAPRPRVKKPCFADEVEVPSPTGWGDNAQCQRRRQRGKVEFLVEDHQTSDDDADVNKVVSKSVKANEISSVEVVDRVIQTLPLKQERQSRQEKRDTPVTKHDIRVHHLVREFLLMHCHKEVVKIFDQERPMPVLDPTEAKELSRQLTGTSKGSENSSVPCSLLERFLVCSNEAKVKTRPKRTSKKTKSSTGRRKPTLNVITDNLSENAGNVVATPVIVQIGGDYNRLNHPGSTPHHQVQGTVIGEPGSTPMHRAKDLRILGYDDVEDDGETQSTLRETKAENSKADENTDQLSDYAQRKRNANTGLKRVQLGNPGSTPTKEYIFFRETPPSFVTETIEDAVDVFEKLDNDPEFTKQAVVIERFIELQSSEVEVSKYSIGQVIEGLGPKANIGGVVSKIYGSRLCGTAGAGAIVIDTCPDSPATSD